MKESKQCMLLIFFWVLNTNCGTAYNEYELALINWTKKQAEKENRDLSTIEYKLDKGANPLFYQRTTLF